MQQILHEYKEYAISLLVVFIILRGVYSYIHISRILADYLRDFTSLILIFQEALHQIPDEKVRSELFERYTLVIKHLTLFKNPPMSMNSMIRREVNHSKEKKRDEVKQPKKDE